MTRSESEARRLALSFLGAVEHKPLSYGDMIEFQKRNNLIYLGAIAGQVFYVPADITTDRIAHVATELNGEPMDSAAARLALYELWLTTKHKQMSQADRDAMLMVYVGRLAHYPAHAVQYVLAHMGAKYQFFPSWSEIEDELSDIMGWRFHLITALRNLHRKLKGTTNGSTGS